MLSDKILQALKDSVEEANETGGSGMNNEGSFLCPNGLFSTPNDNEITELIAKIEMKAKLIQQYTYEKEAMEKELYALVKKAMEYKRQLEIWQKTEKI